MGSLSLQSPPREERTPPRHLPSGREQQPSVGERTSSWQIPPAQPLPPIFREQTLSGQLLSEQPLPQTLREQTLSGQLLSEQPPRPSTRRSNEDGSTQPWTIPPATNPFFRQTSQQRNITNPQPQSPHPPADHVAAYLAVFEAHPRQSDPFHIMQSSRRNCSIIVQSNVNTDKFREFCCIATPRRRPKRHVQFYSSPEIPDPRCTAPGLLDMQFIAWIPHWQLAELDKFMKTWRSRINDDWTHITWITLYLQYLVTGRLITPGQMEKMMIFQNQTLRLPYREDLPNRRRCFPHLY
jgi:hypothetical protein